MLLLDLAYLSVFLVTLPLWLVLLVVKPQFRAGVGQRFAIRNDIRPTGRTIWLHGSSAGEIDLLRPLIAEIESRMQTVADFDAQIESVRSGLDETNGLRMDIIRYEEFVLLSLFTLQGKRHLHRFCGGCRFI